MLPFVGLRAADVDAFVTQGRLAGAGQGRNGQTCGFEQRRDTRTPCSTLHVDVCHGYIIPHHIFSFIVKNTTLLETPWIEIMTGTVPFPGGVRQTMVVSPHEEPAPH